MILLLGRCGLERLAAPLRQLGHQVAVSAWSDLDLVEGEEPELIYVDLYEWTLLTPLVARVLAGRPPSPEHQAALEARRAVVDALRGRPVLYRGLRRPPWGSLQPPPPELEQGLAELAALCADQPVLDLAGLWARHGVLDDGVRFGPGHGEPELGALGTSRLDGRSAAELEAEAVHGRWLARTRGPRKCVVVDLDDTLVYGRIADPGFALRNPAWDPEGRGDPELAWWRAPRGTHLALRELARRGVLLALATRNDPDRVQAAFRRRPLPPGPAGEALALLLDIDDFVAVEAGFGPKSEMIEALAGHLGLGLDRLVFLDDHPVEREEVAQALPQVLCLDGSASRACGLLLEAPELTVLEPSPARELRRASYRSRAAVSGTPRQRLRTFLQGLGIRVHLRPAEVADLPRVRELFQRTNQLALNGARPCPSSVEGLWVAEVRDRLADHGLVAVGAFTGGEGERRLEAWACSCRVLPHQVAATILGAMLEREGGAAAAWEETGRNKAARGLVEEAARGPAAWVELVG